MVVYLSSEISHLREIFVPYVSGAKAPPTGIIIIINNQNQDLSDIFAPYTIGAVTPNENISFAGKDLCQIFQYKNSQAPIPPTNLQLSSKTSNSVTISFTPPNVLLTSYIATTQNGITGTSMSSPITINGLTSGTNYNISIQTINIYGTSVSSEIIAVAVGPPQINPTDISLSLTTAQNFTIPWSWFRGLATSNDGQYILIDTYISNSASIARSSDYGQTWNYTRAVQRTDGDFQQPCASMSDDGKYQSVSAGNPQFGVYVSNDYGVTWQLMYNNFVINGYCKISGNGEKALIVDTWGQAWLFLHDTNGNFSSSSPYVDLNTKTNLKPSYAGGGQFNQNNRPIASAGISGNGEVIVFANWDYYNISTNGGNSFTLISISAIQTASVGQFSNVYEIPPVYGGGMGSNYFMAMSYTGKYISLPNNYNHYIYSDNFGAADSWKLINSIAYDQSAGELRMSMSNDGKIFLACVAGGSAKLEFYISNDFGQTFIPNPGYNAGSISSNNNGWNGAVVSPGGNFIVAVDANKHVYTYRAV